MDYGTGAIFGCPSGDQRDLDFANKYGLPVVPVVMPEGADAKTFRILEEAYVDDGVMINSRFLDGMKPEQAFDEVATRLSGVTVGDRPMARAQGAVPPARLADLAPALLGLPDPGHPLRLLRRGAGAGSAAAGRTADRRHLRQAGQSARPSSDLEACRLPAMRQAGAARHRHDGHVRRFVLVFRPLHRSVERDGADDALSVVDGDEGLAAGQPVYRRHRARDPAPALFALLRPRHEGDRPSEQRRGAVRGPVHAGHGRARDLQGPGRLGDARRGQGRGFRRLAQGVPAFRRHADRDRLDREDVEVEEERRRPRRHHRQLRRRHGALVHALRFAARARRDLDRGRRRGRAPLRAAPLASGVRIGRRRLPRSRPRQHARARPPASPRRRTRR